MPPQSRRFPRFLKELRTHGLDALAAEAAGLELLTVQERQANDADFARECQNARRLVWERLVATAQEQAMGGDARLLVHLLRNNAPPSPPQSRPLLPPVRIIIKGENVDPST